MVGSPKATMQKPEEEETHRKLFGQLPGQDCQYNFAYKLDYNTPVTLEHLKLTSVRTDRPISVVNQNTILCGVTEGVLVNTNNNGDFTVSVNNEEFQEFKAYLDSVLPPDISIRGYLKMEKFVNSGSIKVLLAPQECLISGRTHARTELRNSSANWVLISGNSTTYRCFAESCKAQKIDLESVNETLKNRLFKGSTNFGLISSFYNQTHETISEYILNKVKHDNAASLIKGTTYKWYYFNKTVHRWENYEKLTLEIMNVDGDIQKSYKQYVENLIAEGSSDKESLDSMKKLLSGLLKKLQTTGFVSAGLLPLLGRKLDLEWRSKDGNFEARLDQNPKLLGFTNGVYDFHRREFRPGKPDDFISKSTHNDYYTVDKYPAELCLELDNFLAKAFIDPNHRDYFLQEIALCLNGTQAQQRFFLLTGKGANGKSTIVRLLDMAMGDYSGEAKSSMFTQTMPPSNAVSPDIMALKAKRFVAVNEPNANDTLVMGTIKSMTGGDKQTARNLFENNQSFYLQASFFMLTNDVPRITATDFGTWRRIRLIQFNSQFMLHPNKNKPHQFPLDDEINSKMETWKGLFMSVLIARLVGGKTTRMPTEFAKIIKDLQYKNDIYKRFSDEYITLNPGEGQFVDVNSVFLTFSDWIKSMRLSKVINLDTFLHNITIRLGPPIEYKGKKGWEMKLKTVPFYHG